MKKIISLIKYTIKGDLSLFKLGDNLDKKKKILGSIVLIILLMYWVNQRKGLQCKKNHEVTIDESFKQSVS